MQFLSVMYKIIPLCDVKQHENEIIYCYTVRQDCGFMATNMYTNAYLIKLIMIDSSHHSYERYILFVNTFCTNQLPDGICLFNTCDYVFMRIHIHIKY